MTAPPRTGDSVAIIWADGPRNAGAIEAVQAGMAKLRVAGPPEITLYAAAAQLSEAGPTSGVSICDQWRQRASRTRLAEAARKG